MIDFTVWNRYKGSFCSLKVVNVTNDHVYYLKWVVQKFFGGVSRWVSRGVTRNISLRARPTNTLTYPWPRTIPCLAYPKIIIKSQDNYLLGKNRKNLLDVVYFHIFFGIALILASKKKKKEKTLILASKKRKKTCFSLGLLLSSPQKKYNIIIPLHLWSQRGEKPENPPRGTQRKSRSKLNSLNCSVQQTFVGKFCFAIVNKNSLFFNKFHRILNQFLSNSLKFHQLP